MGFTQLERYHALGRDKGTNMEAQVFSQLLHGILGDQFRELLS